MPDFGSRDLGKGMRGDDVVELQLRLTGFRGTVPDGIFGPGTELQVVSFQKDFMGISRPTGVADGGTVAAIDDFAQRYPFDFDTLKCPCGVCQGFGQGKFKGKYRTGKSRIEAFYRYEYPGIHRMLLWAVRGLFFYCDDNDFIVTSGYRCSENNKQKGRSSTNHHGKAIDVDVALAPGEDKRDDMNRCDAIRGIIVEKSNAQIAWYSKNRKSLEPSDIAPTWIHYDVRSYERKYLKPGYFCTSNDTLNAAMA